MLVRVVLGPDNQLVNIEGVDPPRVLGQETISPYLHTSLIVAAEQVAAAVGQAGKISSISIIIRKED